MASQYIGTNEWAVRTGGTLGLKDRLALVRQVLAPSLAAALRSWLGRGRGVPLDLEDIPLPDTASIRSAHDTLRECASDIIINHSIRTYYWGAALGRVAGVSHDPELLLASCLLHDLGMTPRYHGQHAGCQCFAVEGARAAQAWAAREGWPPERQMRLSEAISLHMNGHVNVENGPEAQLLNRGAACDLIGARYHDMGAAYRETVLARWPRLGLNRDFVEFIARESALRPGSRGSLMRLSGFALLVRANPFRD